MSIGCPKKIFHQTLDVWREVSLCLSHDQRCHPNHRRPGRCNRNRSILLHRAAIRVRVEIARRDTACPSAPPSGCSPGNPTSASEIPHRRSPARGGGRAEGGGVVASAIDASRCNGCTPGSYPGGSRFDSGARNPSPGIEAGRGLKRNPTSLGRRNRGLSPAPAKWPALFFSARPAGPIAGNALLLSVFEQGRLASPGRAPGASLRRKHHQESAPWMPPSCPPAIRLESSCAVT